MLAKQEADQRTEEAMMSGKPVQQEESTDLNRVRSVAIAFSLYILQTKHICNCPVLLLFLATWSVFVHMILVGAGATGSSATNFLLRRHSSLSQ